MKRSTLIILILSLACFGTSIGQDQSHHHYLVQVRIENQEKEGLLRSLNPDFATGRVDSFAEIIIDETELLEYQKYGFKTHIIQELLPNPIDEEYHRYEEVLHLLDNYSKVYPDITFLDTIGLSQRLGYYIPAIKVSDNASMEEDEPAVLFDGLHHAMEPVSMESTLAILEYLLTNYGSDQQVTDWVDNTEIWIAPMLNPDGWSYLYENWEYISYWRKNLRENGNNATIDPDNDGVDINRNYDFNWIRGGSGNPGSNTYRGPEPFSESEARAKRDLALSQKFIVSLSYHSYGEIVIYSWSEGEGAPDHELIYDIASNIAIRVPKSNGEGTYNPTPGSCNTGFSRCWSYGVAGTFEFTVETAPVFLPSGEEGQVIARDNIPGALYVLDRIRGPGLTGNITDKLSGEPLSAYYRIQELYDDVIAERTSDSLYGRYDRLLLPGNYTLIVSKEGYLSDTIPDIFIADGEITELDVELIPIVSGIEDIRAYPLNNEVGLSQNYPNPMTNFTTIKYYTKSDGNIRIEVLDLMGKTVAVLRNEWHSPGNYTINWNGTNSSGQKLPPGFYLYSIKTSRDTRPRVSTTRKLLII